MGEIKEVKSMPIMPFATMAGAISGVLAFIWSILFAIFGAVTLAFVPADQIAAVLAWGLVGMIIFIIVMTIAAFIGGFIMYAIIAFIYNFLASKIGGIKLELE